MPATTFYDCIVRTPGHRAFLFAALALSLVGWAVFKLLYPFADYFSDSYNYIGTALNHLSVNIWPVGYPRFLALLHAVSHAETFTVTIQFLLVQASLLFFFFTVTFFFAPGIWAKRLFFCFLFVNPLFHYLSNYISSDALFLALSLCWFTQLIWILHRPGIWLLLSNAFLLFAAFTCRYNAMIYPLVAILALFLSRLHAWAKWTGSLLPLLLIGLFIVHTRQKTSDLTGTRQFSVFSGWQLANNALYMYPFIQVDSSRLPPQCRELDQFSRFYFTHCPPELLQISPYQGAWYIRYSKSPLKRYASAQKDYKSQSLFQAWGAVSPVYQAYGSFLIRHNPIPFARYFLLPNSKAWLLPPLEKLEVYNLGADSVWATAPRWFNYKNNHVTSISPTAQGALLFLYPMFFGVLQLALLLVLGSFLLSKGWRLTSPLLNKTIAIGACLLLLHAGFSIVAAPVVFRYQVFSMLLSVAFTILLYKFLMQDKPSVTVE